MKILSVIPIDLALPPRQHSQGVSRPVLAAALRLAKKQKAIVVRLAGENLSHPTSRNRPIAIANDYLSDEVREERCGLGPKDIAPYEKAMENDSIASGRRKKRKITTLHSPAVFFRHERI